MSEKEEVEEKMGEIVKVEVQLYKPFVEFMKDLLNFFGSKETLEDFCREIIHEQCRFLYRELEEFAKESTHLLSDANLDFKYAEIAIGAFKDPEENEKDDC